MRRSAIRAARISKLAVFIVVAVLGTLLQAATASATTPTVTTDKADYAPGELVTVTGTGFAPSTTYDVPIIRPNGSIVLGDGSFLPGWDSATTDANGDFTYIYQLNGIQGSYEVRVYDSPWSGDRSLAPVASHLFTDAASADLDQCENGPLPAAKTACVWANGNLGTSNSQYVEGDSVAFRLKFAGVAPGGSHTATIEYDSIEGGVHAYDQLTSWNHSETGNLCTGLSAACAGYNTDTEPIPVDARVTAGPDGVLATGDDLTAVGGNFTMRGGTITAVSGYTHSNPDPNTAGTNKTSITVTFSPNVSTPVLAWGGHIATRQNWRPDPSAVSDTNGSPYHMRRAFDGGNVGQDKSLKASAVVFPAKITIIKDSIPDDAQNFTFTTTGGTLAPTNFTLDDDADGTLPNTQVYSNIQNFTTYTVTEGAATGFTLTDIVCTVLDADGGTQTKDLALKKITIALKEGEEVTCTFKNTEHATLTLVKDAVPDHEQDFSFTTTGTGMTNVTLDDDADGTNPSSKVYSFDTTQFGAKTITEGSVAGWSLTDINCSEGTEDEANRKATVTIDAGDNVTCTFTNKKDASLKIIKDAVPDDAQNFSFTTTGTGMSDFDLDDDADGTLPNEQLFTFTGSQLGSKTVTEGAVGGWSLIDLDCSEGTEDLANRVATIQIDAGDQVTCTFKNSKNATLTIKKDAVPNDGQDFGFTATGSGTSAFTLDDDADGTFDDEQTFTFNSTQLGSKVITEGTVAGWTLTDISCSEGTEDEANRKATIQIDAGDNVTCTFENTKHAKLTIRKDADPNDGQDFGFTATGSGTSAFDLDDDANGTLSNEQVFTFTGNQLGSKVITEAAVTGWSLAAITCSEGTEDEANRKATIQIDAGDDVTCTFVNEKNATLQITKDADPNDGQNFDFTTTGSGITDFSLDDDADGTLSNTTTFTFASGQFGSKTVTEGLVAGWSLANITCSQGTEDEANRKATVVVDAGDVITCTFLNEKDATVTITKDSDPNDAQNFGFTTTGSGWSGFDLDDDADGTLPNTTGFTFKSGQFGSKTVTEDAVTGWSLANITCSQGTEDEANRKATLQVDPGDAITCTFLNHKDAELTIVKDSSPNDGQNFSFTTTGSAMSDFDLDDDADGTLSNTKSFTFKAGEFGSKTVTEGTAAGWDLASITCSPEGTEDEANRKATIQIDPGDDVTCTFLNEKRATVQITKDALPNDTQNFSYTTTGSGWSDFDLDDDADGTLPNSRTFTFKTGEFGQKVVTEGTTASWSLSSIDCNEGVEDPNNRKATIDVDPGDVITCTFTNSKDATLLIVKDADPNDAQNFAFTTTGSAISDFDLDDDADGTLASSRLFTFRSGEFGTKTVTEGAVAGWALADIDCSEGTEDEANRKATVAVDPGDVITCTFLNEKDATLTIKKDAVPNHEQDFGFTTNGTGLADFDLDDDADGTLSDEQNFTFTTGEFGTKIVTEDGVAGWSLTEIDCSQGAEDETTRTATIDIDPGDDVTCTFTNKQDATLTITKVANPDHAQNFHFVTTGAGLSDFDLDDDADGTLSDTKSFTISGADFGTKTVTEDAVVGWDLGDIQCSEGTEDVPNRKATVDVDPGDDIDCTFTNNKVASLKITKDSDPDHEQDFAFTTTGTGMTDATLDDDADGTNASSETYVFLTGMYGTKTVTEGAVAGWSLADIDCSEGTEDETNRKVTVDIDPGDDVECTFLNEKDAKLTVAKDADPDHEQDFNFTGTAGPTFDLDDDADGTLSNTTSFTYSSGDFGTKTVIEGAVTGWSLTDIDCSEGTEDEANLTATVDIDPGDDVTCTFTNTARVSVQVVKTEVGTAATGQFTFTLTGGPAPGVNIAKTTNDGTDDDTLEFPGLLPGTYKICETVPTGYGTDLGPDGNGDPCDEFTLTPGDAKVIGVDNTPCPAGTLTVQASMNSGILQGAETQSFKYDIDGPNGPLGTITITFAAGDPATKSGSITTPIAGTYTVTQQADPDVAPNPPATVDILPGTCSGTLVSPAALAPTTATVRKITLPAGSEAGWDFTLRRNGVPVETVTSVGAGVLPFGTPLDEAVWTIIETPKPGFIQISAIGCAFTVDLPADANTIFNCTVTNEAVTGGTIIKSEKLPGKPLRKARGHWTFYIRGGPDNVSLKSTTNTGGGAAKISSSMAFAGLRAGDYTICEQRYPGWKSNLGGKKGYRAPNGDRCVNMRLNAAQPAVLKVTNTCSSLAAKTP